MCKTKSILLLFLFMLPAICWSQQPQKANYQPGVIVFKIKTAENSTYANRQGLIETQATVAAKLKAKVGATNILQPFAGLKNAKNKNQVQKQGSSALDGIFKMELSEGMSVEEAVEMLQLQPEIEYAEPYYLPQLLETPNDTGIGSQTHLPIIKAPQAWDIQRGSREIIIAVLDTGVDTTHADLRENLHKNENDPIDGVDNDEDGYVDNYWGWDFANNDNNPTADKNGHGTQVAGTCSATTNNALGIAGTGYNSRYMPIKVFSSISGNFVNGYEAIVYAADMGCQVINLSWGAPSAPSKYVQDIIDYVVLEKDVVVVASAGNDAKELDFYPASYENVLSVTATDNTDQKAAWCTWSRFVDIVAPGVVYTTRNGNQYTSTTGTSYSAPMVSGAAALVRAQFPELNAAQVMELLRQSADDISQVGNNANFQYRIGHGRLNMEAALQGIAGPSIRMSNLRYSNGIGNYAFHNDSVSLWMDFTNYFNVAEDVTVRLVSESDYATVLDAEIQLGDLQSMQTLSNSQPFRFHLSADLPALALLSFRLEFTAANGYTDYQYFNFRTSGEYIDFRIDDLTLTIGSNGNLGYNYDYNLQGLGLRYQNAPLAHNMGLVIAQNPAAIANNIVNNMVPTRRNLDFKTIERLRLYNDAQADMDARSSFEVKVSDSTQLNLRVDQKVLGWSDPTDAAAVVLEYKIINRADTAYDNLHISLFADFNLTDFFLNKALWDASNQLGYTYNAATSRYAGIALLSQQEPLHYALDLGAREGNTADIGATLSRRQKWDFISQGVANTEAGASGRGNDVAKFTGGTIGSLAPISTEKVVFAMVTASSLEALQEAVQRAQQNYNVYTNAIPLLLSAEACIGIPLALTPKPGSSFRFYSDKAGHSLIAEGETISFPVLTKDTTIYAINLDYPWPGEMERIEVVLNNGQADFSMSADQLVLNAGLTEHITFTDQTPNAASWLWDFGNGITSTQQNNEIIYTEAGTYQISLTVTTLGGCTATASSTLTVLRKEDLPQIESTLYVCLNTPVAIEDNGRRPINVYADANKETLIYSGDRYESAPLTAQQQYFVTIGSGITESDVLMVTVNMYEAQLHITHNLDLGSTSKYAVNLLATYTEEAAVRATEIRWYHEGSLLGTGNALSFPYDAGASSPEVTLVVQFDIGCEEQLQQVLPLYKDALPQVQDLEVCKNDTPLIQPQAEGTYYYYADEQLEQLLHKGAFYQMESLTSTRTIYITNMTGGLESNAVPLTIRLPEDLAAFTLSADTLPLENNEASVSFSSSSTEATKWSWNFGDGNSSNVQNPTHLYTTTGTFTVTLVAENSLGCSETFTKQLVIAEPQGLDANSIAGRLICYPNPTYGLLNIALPLNVQPEAQLIVLDATGRKVMHQQLASGHKIIMDMQAYAKGFYVIQILDGKQIWQSRIVNK